MNAPKVEKYPEDYKFKDIKKELVGWDSKFKVIVKEEEEKAINKLKVLTKKIMKYNTAITFDENDVEEARIMFERIKGGK